MIQGRCRRCEHEAPAEEFPVETRPDGDWEYCPRCGSDDVTLVPNDQTMYTVAGVERLTLAGVERLTLMKVCRLLRENDHRRAERDVREAFGINEQGEADDANG